MKQSNQATCERLQAALDQISDIARSATGCAGDSNSDSDFDDDDADTNAAPGCVVKALPARLVLDAAKTAIEINPMNAPVLGRMAAAGDGFDVTDPMRLAVLTSKYWGPVPRTLSVSFMESTPSDLKNRIVGHMNAWTRTSCISFRLTNGTGNIRISRNPGGYWSYLGTDVLRIPTNRPTMNLQGFTMSTSESEYRRVVRHETGHTMGFPHEHMRRALIHRIDPQRAYDWFLRTYGWDRATVDSQVLTPLDERSIMSTPADQTSIMCYQLPGSITRDGRPIVGGSDINGTDFAFAGRIYPRAGRQLTALPTDEWPESEDVDVAA